MNASTVGIALGFGIVLVGCAGPGPQPKGPDLVPESKALQYCARDARGNLLVTVRNQGNAPSVPCTTTVVFGDGTGTVNVPTPSLPAGSSLTLPPVPMPAPCWSPDCSFEIKVDSSNVVTETKEDNNDAEGWCVG